MSPMVKESDDELCVCQACAVEPMLASLARPAGASSRCVLCLREGGNLIDINCRGTKEAFRAALRFHYSEWAYNGHLGGNEISQVLSSANPIIDHGNKDGVHEICDRVYESGYETADLGISLFAGYSDIGQNPPLEAISAAEDALLARIRERLLTENHFRSAKDLCARLQVFRSYIVKILHDETLVRARIGVKTRAQHWVTGRPAYVPFSGSDLMAPPPPLATPGRINRGGVSFLYAASSAATAVAEVRPHPGHLVSIGRVVQRQYCKIADFSEVRLMDFATSDEALDQFVFLRTIERKLATPIVPEERDKYSLGQLVADVLREMGFDGIAYRSSVADGKNYCFFDPRAFRYVNGSGKVVEVQGLRYQARGLPAIPRLTSEYRDLVT